ncbi:MAG: SIMPL domain-containing protein [Verrucomicrobiota bacterium]|nr:SIMPL domain-containing protein [Verrucomicrobiota bacterium]
MIKTLLSCLLLLAGTLLYAGGLPNAPYIYVVGEAYREVPADIVQVSIEINACDKVEANAGKLVNQRMEKLFTLLNALGVAENDITAVSEEISGRWGDAERTEFQCYEVSRQTQIIIRNLAQYGNIVQALHELPVNGLNFVSVDATNRDAITKELEEEARLDAQKKAETITASFGTKIIGVYAISPRSISELDERWPYATKYHGSFSGSAGSMKFIIPQVPMTSEAHVIFLIKDNPANKPATNP